MKLNYQTDPTWGSGIMHKRLVLVAVKVNGEFTEAEMIELHKESWSELTDNASMTLKGKDIMGHELVLIYDVYVVKQLGFFPRMRHAFRMLSAAIARNHKHTSIREITLK